MGERASRPLLALAMIAVLAGCAPAPVPAPSIVEQARSEIGRVDDLERRVIEAFLVSGVSERQFEQALSVAFAQTRTWISQVRGTDEFLGPDFDGEVTIRRIGRVLCDVGEAELNGVRTDILDRLEEEFADVQQPPIGLFLDMLIQAARAGQRRQGDRVATLAGRSFDCAIANAPA